MRRRPLLAAALTAGLLIGLTPFGLALYVSEQIMRPPYSEHRTVAQGLAPGRWTDPRTDFGIPYEDVEFDAVDGSTLRGWWVPSSSPTRAAVVAAHGGGSDRRSFHPLIPAIHEGGYAMLLFDAREHGISAGSGRGMSLGIRESADVSSAVRYARTTRGSAWVAVIGSSQGATSAILAAAEDPGIDAVIAQGTGTTLYEMMRANRELAPFPDWMVRLFARAFLWRVGVGWDSWRAMDPRPHAVIDRIAPRPVFLIQGSEDQMAPASQALRNFERAGEPKEIWIVEGAGHSGLREHTGGEYARRVLEFLDGHAPRVRRSAVVP